MTTRDPGPVLADGDAFDVAIIGGGASGLAAAIACAREGAGVLVIERDVEPGLPILATGNGRCNVSNAHLDPARYLHPDTARAVMGAAPEREVAAFLASVGIWTVEEDGRLYPYSRRSESVRDALLGAAGRLGVAKAPSARVERASFDADGGCWDLAVSEPRDLPRAQRKGTAHARLRALRRAADGAPRAVAGIRARALVVACGGSSRAVAELFSLPHIDERPVLCPVACEPAAEGGGMDGATLELLDGLRAESGVSLERDGTEVWHGGGEVLFRPYGLSGIVAFDLSRRAERGDAIRLDLFDHMATGELAGALAAREQVIGPIGFEGERWFDGVLDRRLARAVLRQAGPGAGAADVARAAKGLAFRCLGTAEERSAQVRRGGIPLDAVGLPDLALKPGCALQPGSFEAGSLFACGEALDMDADCGGFNLAWAWLSGIRAGRAAARAVRRR